MLVDFLKIRNIKNCIFIQNKIKFKLDPKSQQGPQLKISQLCIQK